MLLLNVASSISLLAARAAEALPVAPAPRRNEGGAPQSPLSSAASASASAASAAASTTSSSGSPTLTPPAADALSGDATYIYDGLPPALQQLRMRLTELSRPSSGTLARLHAVNDAVNNAVMSARQRARRGVDEAKHQLEEVGFVE